MLGRFLLCRFCVLVAGTLVYGRGDEEGAKEEMAAILEEPEAAQQPAAETTPLLIPPAAVPVAAPAAAGSYAAAEPIPVSSSFKATMTMVTGSYSRSFTRGSLQNRTHFMHHE